MHIETNKSLFLAIFAVRDSWLNPNAPLCSNDTRWTWGATTAPCAYPSQRHRVSVVPLLWETLRKSMAMQQQGTMYSSFSHLQSLQQHCYGCHKGFVNPIPVLSFQILYMQQRKIWTIKIICKTGWLHAVKILKIFVRRVKNWKKKHSLLFLPNKLNSHEVLMTRPLL